jgi:hypothetical protein
LTPDAIWSSDVIRSLNAEVLRLINPTVRPVVPTEEYQSERNRIRDRLNRILPLIRQRVENIQTDLRAVQEREEIAINSVHELEFENRFLIGTQIIQVNEISYQISDLLEDYGRIIEQLDVELRPQRRRQPETVSRGIREQIEYTERDYDLFRQELVSILNQSDEINEQPNAELHPQGGQQPETGPQGIREQIERRCDLLRQQLVSITLRCTELQQRRAEITRRCTQARHDVMEAGRQRSTISNDLSCMTDMMQDIEQYLGNEGARIIQ